MDFDVIFSGLRKASPKRMAVAAAEDEAVLDAVLQAAGMDLVTPILIGDGEKIREMLAARGARAADHEIVETGSVELSARAAVQMVSEGRADAVMKGLLQTHVLLREVLNKEYGIRRGELLSHVGIIELRDLGRLLFITDGGMVMYPDLKQKAELIRNATHLARSLGVDCPKVACVCAIETVNPGMPATVDAAALALMGQRGQLGNCVVDGPLGLDNAVFPDAAEHKGVKSPVKVAGQADILLVPSIETGNAVMKMARYVAKCRTAGLIVGAAAPVVVTSRADTLQNKLCAIGCALSATGA